MWWLAVCAPSRSLNAMADEFKSRTVYDALASFEAGMNSGEAPLLLEHNQLSFATNVTVRGSYATHRPPFSKQVLDFGGDAALETAVTTGLFQGSAYYKPDSGIETLMASLSGRLYQFTPGLTGWVVRDVSIPGDPNSPNPTQVWMWQAEKWMIVTDGTQSLPIFFDGVSSRRSIGNNQTFLTITAASGPLPGLPATPQVTLRNVDFNHPGIVIYPGTYNGPIGPNFTPFVAPAIGATVVVDTSIYYTGPLGITTSIPTSWYGLSNWIIVSATTTAPLSTFTLTLAANIFPQWAAGTPVQGLDIGEYVVVSWPAANQVLLQRISDIGPAPGTAVPIPSLIYPELPAGRMGAYGMGRVWMSLIDAKQFVAGDINGGPSGTFGNNYRDAVLHVSENTFLAGGGYFSTPGSHGDIRAMIFTTTLDVSMGQGPLLVCTPTHVFSCFAPVDRTTWALVTNPILTESLIANSAESQWSTVNANSDVIFRAVDGIRSFIQGRRDFETYGNVPISTEMDRVLSLDVEALLLYGSAIVFDNRLLMTVGPSPVPEHGVFHNGLVALNFDPLSNLRGKAPSVYDGLWTGMNVLQLLVGRFEASERAFAFTYNLAPAGIELFELLPTPTDVFSTTNWPTKDEIMDNGQIPIVWAIESPVLFHQKESAIQQFHRWLDSEIQIDNLVGSVDFAAFYKPDQYPCWIPWFTWSECAGRDSTLSKPQFRPRMGLGEPSPLPCDVSTNRPFREFYTVQVKLIVQGHCRLLAWRFKANTIPIPAFAPQSCSPPCSELVVT